MKLIQIDNTLYIVEGENKYKVSEESYVSFMNYATFKVNGNEKHNNLSERRDKALEQGIDITDIQHRIQIREVKITLAKSGGIKEGLIIEPATIIDGKPYKVSHEAFLLPEKEVVLENKEPAIWLTDPTKVKADITYTLPENILTDYVIVNNKKYYPIEQIEKAIDESVRNFDTMMSIDKAYRVKQAIINNLTKCHHKK